MLKANLGILKDLCYQGKNVIITGGGSGLGKQMALNYSKLGAHVTIVGRNEEKLLNTKQEIENDTKNEIFTKSMDVRDHEQLADYIDNLGDNLPDVVINNAAGNFISPTTNLSYNAWNTIIDIVLKGTMNFTLQFGKKLIEQEKHANFINISTTYAKTGSGFVVPSAVAKAGCDNLTKSLSAEWGKYGIRLNSIAPGPIYTEGAFSRLDPTGEFQSQVINTLPMRRLGEKQELANLVSFITSDYCNWMTGQIINLDGGEVIQNSGEFNILNRLTIEDWEEIYKKMK